MIGPSPMAASEIQNYMLRQQFLKHSIRNLNNNLAIKNQKIKSIQKIVRKQQKEIATMKNIIMKLQNKNPINENDGSFTLLESFGKLQNLITNWSKKKCR
jgi:hypothetical protein